MENGAEEEYAVALSELVTQYYEDAAQIPKEVLLPAEITDAETVEEWLREKRGGKVAVLVPQRGEKRRLVEMAESNARESLKQMTQRASDEKAAALEGMEQLQDVLDLPALPGRIECYDISNIQGTEAVGSMVVLRDGKPAKDQYRRFKIKGLPAEPNDFLMMQQVFRRRLQNALDGDAKFLPLPDLVVIDGGKGQLSAATAVMEELGVQLPIIGLAKREEEVFVPDRSEPMDLPKHSPGNHMLQRLRDEAHRFALTYHRQLRGKQAIVSMLDQIPGVGKTRRTALLKHFGSVVEMKEANLEALAKAPGMNKAVAAALFAALHEEDTPDREGGTGDLHPEAIPSLAKGTRSLSDLHPDPQGRFLATNVIGRRKR
jgi:excinuclease ABC subunit C